MSRPAEGRQRRHQRAAPLHQSGPAQELDHGADGAAGAGDAACAARTRPQQAADVLAQAGSSGRRSSRPTPPTPRWVPLLQYHHGVALREAGKRAEARAVFDQVVKAAPDRPEAADAALRFGQCLRDDGQQKIADAAKKLATPGLKPEEIAAAPEADGRRRQGPARRGAVPQRPGRAAEAEAAGFAGPRPHVLRGGLGLPGAGRPGSEGGPRQDAAGPLAEAQGRDRQEDAAGPAAAVRAAAGRAADRRADAAVRDAGPHRVPGADRGLPRPDDQRRRPLRAGRDAVRAAANTTPRSSSCRRRWTRSRRRS